MAKTFNKMAAQGDLLLVRVDAVPPNAEKVEAKQGKYIVAHSETGHHHFVQAPNVEYFVLSDDPMTAFLEVKAPADLKHDRTYDTHETIRFDVGTFMLRRQREGELDAWRRVED